MAEFQHKKLLIAGSLSAFTIQSLAAVMSFGMNVFVARLLDADGYGLYAYAVSWANVLAILCCLGIDSNTLRFLPAYRANSQWPELRGLVKWSAFIVMGASVITVAFLEFWISRLHISGAKQAAIQIGLLMVPAMSLLALGQAILRSFKSIVQALLPNGVLRPALMITGVLLLLVAFNVRKDADNVLLVLVGAVYLAMLYQYSRVFMRLQGVPRTGSAEFRPRLWLSVALPLVAMAALTTLLGQLDILMLGSLGTTRETGFYSAAVRFATLASFGLTAANMIVAPLISELYYTGRFVDLRRMIRYVTGLITVFALLVTVIFIFLGRQLLSIFGTGYAAAYIPALILLSGQVVNAITGPVGYLLILTGRQYQALAIYALACAFNVAINIAAIPRYGMYGAATATAFSVALSNALMYLVAKRSVLASGHRGHPA